MLDAYNWIKNANDFLEKNLVQDSNILVRTVIEKLQLARFINLEKLPLDITLSEYQYYVKNQTLVKKEITYLINIVKGILPDNWIRDDAINYFPKEIKDQVELIGLLRKIINNEEYEYQEVQNQTYNWFLELLPTEILNHDVIPYPLTGLVPWKKLLLDSRVRVDSLLETADYIFDPGPFKSIESETFNLTNSLPELKYAEYLSAKGLYLTSLKLLKTYFPAEWFISESVLEQNFKENTLFVTSYFEIEKTRKVLENINDIMANGSDTLTIAELFSNFPGILFDRQNLPIWLRYTSLRNCFKNNTLSRGIEWNEVSKSWINESSTKLQDFFSVEYVEDKYLLTNWNKFYNLCCEINNFSRKEIIDLKRAFEYWNKEEKKNNFYLSDKVLSQIRNESFDTEDVSLREYLIQLCGGRSYDSIFKGGTIKKLDTTLISSNNDESFFVKWNNFLKNYYQLGFKFGNEFLIRNFEFDKWIELSEEEINQLNQELSIFLSKIEGGNRSYYSEFSNLFKNNVTRWLNKTPEEFKVANHSLFIPKKTDFELEYQAMWEKLIKEYETFWFKEMVIFKRPDMIRYIRNLNKDERYIIWFEANKNLRTLLTKEVSDFKVEKIFDSWCSKNLLYLNEEDLKRTLSDYLAQISGVRNPHSEKWEWGNQSVNTTGIEMLSDQSIYDATALEDCKEEVISLASKVISLLESKFKLPDCWIKSIQAIELRINKISNLEKLKKLAIKYESQLDNLNEISRKTFYEQTKNSVKLKSSNLKPFLVLENIPEIKDFSLEKTISNWNEDCESYDVILNNNDHFTTARTISNAVPSLINKKVESVVPQITSENNGNTNNSYSISKIIVGSAFISLAALKIIEALDLLKSKNSNPEVESRRQNVVIPMKKVLPSQVERSAASSKSLLNQSDDKDENDIFFECSSVTTYVQKDSEQTSILIDLSKKEEDFPTKKEDLSKKEEEIDIEAAASYC